MEKAVRIAALIAAAFVLSRGSLPEGSFVVGVAFIAYMMSLNVMNLYLVLPAAAGLVPYIYRGCDTWGYIASIIVCAIVLAAAGRMGLRLWQRGLIAASTETITLSAYRLLTKTVYLSSPGEMILEGVLIFICIYIFDYFYRTAKGREVEGKENMPAVFTAVSMMFLNGLGLTFLFWIHIVFISVWMLTCVGTYQALQTVIAGAIAATLMGETQWGVMATIIIGVAAASLVKGRGTVIELIVFAAACRFAGFADGDIVLGIDAHCLLIPVLLFAVTYWKFGEKMRKIIRIFSCAPDRQGQLITYIDELLKDRGNQLAELRELYSTYMDSRAVMAEHFNMSKQIIDDIKRQMNRVERKKRERLTIKTTISQCAAGGTINGDCCGWQDLNDDRRVMVLSDGMGKGKKAAAESLMVTKTMLSLLKAGVNEETALKLINTIMLTKENEDSYATLDMVVIDKITGKTKFYKIGAAPTLIRRKSNVEEVKLSAVPLGIVNGLKTEYVEAVLKKGDWVIMMSDGVSDGGERKSGFSAGTRFLERIKETAGNVRSKDPGTMGDLIMNRAIDSYADRERDDMTVMVARIL